MTAYDYMWPYGWVALLIVLIWTAKVAWIALKPALREMMIPDADYNPLVMELGKTEYQLEFSQKIRKRLNEQMREMHQEANTRREELGKMRGELEDALSKLATQRNELIDLRAARAKVNRNPICEDCNCELARW